MNTKDEIKALLEDAIEETGISLQQGTEELALYAAERSAYLATLVDQPGFNLAVRAERDAVALQAGLSATAQADSADARVVGVIQGALFWAAKVLAAA